MDQIQKVLNVNIAGYERLVSPKELKEAVPVTEKALHNVLSNRLALQNILDGRDERLFIVVGPCSIHDTRAALEYAGRLKELAGRVADRFLMIMRVYFEKPRTTVGWKGLINDPRLDDSFHIEEGLKVARTLLIQINEMGLAAGTEALDPITPQYLSELITWSAIGARTTESQTHRELASGLSMPVGFKNATNGSIQVAINALKASEKPHHFLGIDENGRVCKFSTRGNRYGHVILRGGGGKPNYDAESVAACVRELAAARLRPRIVIDCSHANSGKDPARQPVVLADGIRQVITGSQSIVGFMMESHLFGGNQEIPEDLSRLKYGVSVTDKCLGWGETERAILEAYERLSRKN